MIWNISQKIHNVNRIRQIFQVLVKYGFGYIVNFLNEEYAKLTGKQVLEKVKVQKTDLFHQPLPLRIRKIFEELGTTFIKLGQVLSTRPDLIPVQFCKEFEKLQDEAPRLDFAVIEKQIESELNAPVASIFSFINEEPCAAASIAQVHEAKLLDDTQVVLKVQRPGIETIIKSDIEIFYAIARLLDKYFKENDYFKVIWIVKEFEKTILRELDFRIEMNNIYRFRKNFSNSKSVYIPYVFREYSTSKLLVIEKIEGEKISSLYTDEEFLHTQKKVIAKNLANAVLQQIFIDGFFHADPHPGNIFYSNGRIVFLDFGMTGYIDMHTRLQLSSILKAVSHKDVENIIKVLLKLSVIDEKTDLLSLEEEISYLIDVYSDMPLAQLKAKDVISDILRVITIYKVKILPVSFLLGRTLMTLEGIGRKLYPDFQLLPFLKPFLIKLFKKSLNPGEMVKKVFYEVSDFYEYTINLPKEITQTLDRLKQGQLKIEFENRGTDRIIRFVARLITRIILALLSAALIIGASIILHSSHGPFFWGYPLLGLAGLVLAFIMVIWIIILSIRDKL